MLEIVSWFVITVITYLVDSYVYSKLVNEKNDFSFKKILILIIFSVFNCYISINFNLFIKGLITDLLIFLYLKIIFNKSNTKTLIGTMFLYLGFVLSELIFSIIFVINIDRDFFTNSTLGMFITNLLIFIIFLILFSSKKIVNNLKKLIEWSSEIKILNTICTVMLAILLCFIFIYPISLNQNIGNNIVLACVNLVGIFLFITGYFKEKSGNNKLTIEYNQLLDYVKTYENEIIEKSKVQHEYQNQLIVIDDMLPKHSQKAKDYIKNLISINSENKNTQWLNKLKYLPEGGLKGFVFYKIQKMLENKIDVYVEIDNDLSDKKIWNICDIYLEDISRILGVYLDNAIEAASKSKKKQIIIQFKNVDSNIQFELSNTYDGNLNLSKIDKEGYSTKGKNRGYGLSLVKDIIENNKNLKQSREINGKFYVQKLLIKNK